MRPIKTGQTEGNFVLVESGLQPGEEVVVDGQYKLQPGTHVEATSPQQTQQAQSTPGGSARPHRGGKS
jgi:multidrug efflux system membrane fusion protein